MGQTPSEVQREIDELRSETTRIVEELEYRARHAADLRSQVQRHPVVTAVVSIGLLSAAGLAIFSTVRRQRHSNATLERVSRARQVLGDTLAERMQEIEERRRPSLAKRVLWTVVSTILVTTAGFLARRFAASVWTAAVGEQPPKKAGLA